ncbi:AAA family ATPase [Heliobacterium mobile]|uniref:AAA family ATPase n=1 Tax=Heliobacterium mobile TaxID=28064 RepID=UPI0022A76164|nr:AAA family ATPase [Heliobacterium mobile]
MQNIAPFAIDPAAASDLGGKGIFGLDIIYVYVAVGILLPIGCIFLPTYIAKATAGECNARFIPVHITDVLDPYHGVSEQNLRDIFSSDRAQKPSILFLDELDAIGFNRRNPILETCEPWWINC